MKVTSCSSKRGPASCALSTGTPSDLKSHISANFQATTALETVRFSLLVVTSDFVVQTPRLRSLTESIWLLIFHNTTDVVYLWNLLLNFLQLLLQIEILQLKSFLSFLEHKKSVVY